MRYEGDIYRPPSEAKSYLLQCTIGCSHNQCTFCGMYKKTRFRRRELDEIMTDIDMAAERYPQTEKVFLCDGDALAMPAPDLARIISRLYQVFPRLRHVGTYTGPQSILEKTEVELRSLQEAGLSMGYLGVESGDDQVLQRVRKGVGAAGMLAAGRKFRAAGMKLSCMVLLGLAGAEGSRQHARLTGQLLSGIDPEYVSALTLMPAPGTAMARQMASGEFILPDQRGILEELREIISRMEVSDCLFRSNHASNYLNLGGHLPEDKERMLALLSEVLANEDHPLLRPDRLRRI